MLDMQDFPLVFMRDAAPSGGDAEAQLEALLDRGQRFVMIANRPADRGAEPPEQRKARALALKRNKTRLRRLCAGAIIIEDTTPTPALLRLAAQGFGKAFGIPFLFVSHRAEAEREGRRLLDLPRP